MDELNEYWILNLNYYYIIYTIQIPKFKKSTNDSLIPQLRITPISFYNNRKQQSI
jgi:hypothetical protein